MGNSEDTTENRTVYLEKRLKDQRFISSYEKVINHMISQILKESAKYERKQGRDIIAGYASRIKSPESCIAKLRKKNRPIDFETAVTTLNDIGGIRIICYYMDDVYEMAKMIGKMPGFGLIKIKDYIDKPKATGYQGLHLILQVTEQPELTVAEEVSEKSEQTITGVQLRQAVPEVQPVRIEIQLRTLAMDFWARIDHQLCYKQKWSKEKGRTNEEDQKTAELYKILKRYASEISRLDMNIMDLRERVENIR